MIRPMIPRILIIAILCSSTLYAQEPPRADRESDGTLVNQDYFTADQYPESKTLLVSVEVNHLNKKVLTDVFSGRFEGAVPDLKYTLKRFPNHPKALILLGSVAKQTKDFLMPIPYYEKATRLYPQYALIYAQYGTYLVDIGQLNTGVEKLKKAIEIDSKLALAYASLAKAYYKGGDRKLGRQAADEATALGYKGKITEQGIER